MKTLANCNPLEFLTQTNKIRKSVESWLTLTKVMEIRKNLPEYDPKATKDENIEELNRQVQKNLSDMLDAVLEEHPKETAELLCLVCFIEPEDMEKHTMIELLGAIKEIINNAEVISFFASLARLVLNNTSGLANP